MPVISKIRFTNVIYENGNKRYQDEIFHFDGNNSTIVLENGGGKTVWVQAALQAILPHTEVAGRKAYETFLLSEGPAHIAIEWMISQKPRRYLVTAVSLYEQSQRLQSYRYVYEYPADDAHSLDKIPYVEDIGGGLKRPTDRLGIQEYYSRMVKNNMNAKTFSTIEKYYEYISGYHIIAAEWKKIAEINGGEGDVAGFFEKCKTTTSLVEGLLIPIVEDAISGGGTKNFVEAFEKQREHIKRYKQLKHQINECEHILEKVKGFTGNFEEWDKEHKAFNQLKGQAKAVFYLIEEEDKKTIQEHQSQLQEQDNIAKDLDILAHKKASYELQILKKEVEEKHKQYQNALEEFEKVQLQSSKTSHRIASLEYAKIRQDLEDNHKEEVSIHEAIKRLSQDDTSAEIEASLEENSQYLSGYYKNAIEEIEKEITQFENEKWRNLDQLKKDGEKKEILEKEKKGLDKEKTIYETKIQEAQKEMKRLEQTILDMPQHETVETKKQVFQKRLQAIEKEIRQGYDKIKEGEHEQETLGSQKTTLTKELDELKHLFSKNQHSLNNLEEAHTEILGQVQRASHRWSNIDSIYQNALILSSIETQIEKTRIELKEVTQQERMSLRWLDDYAKGDYFIADPRILSRIEEWKKEFALLLTGSEYIKETTTSNFPYWAVTLITTDQEVQKLRGYIEENKDHISHPIWVMTEYEATKYLQGEYHKDENFIFPGLWETNIQASHFKEWKQQLSQKANIAQTKKDEVQLIHQNWQSLKQAILKFKDQYPQELLQELRKNEFDFKQDINKKENRLATINRREKEIIIEQKSLVEEGSQLDKEQTNIEGRMMQITVYQEKFKQVEQDTRQLSEIIGPRLATISPEIEALIKQIKDLNDQLEEIKEFLWEKDRNKGQIHNEALYLEVKKYSPLYSSYSKEVLQKEREELKRELDQRQKGRRELEEQLMRIQQDRITQQERQDNKLLDNPGLDQTIRFITEHTEEIKSLIKNRRKLERLLEPLSESKENAKIQYHEDNGKYQGQEEEFMKAYHTHYTWELPLSTVGPSLQKETKDLNSKMAYIKDQIKKTSSGLDQIKDAKSALQLKNERFQYLRDDIPAAQLQENEKLDILYQKEKYIREIIKNMEKADKTVILKAEELQKEEQRFTHFCRTNITDIRLQEQTLKGIEKLTQYEEVSQWENNLHSRIMRTKKIAEDDIQTHQEELELFIEFIHSYVQQVADGLGEIHRKTRVKIDDKWKDVYTITVPQWEKLKGKEEIQNYILWIIEQLESDKYPEETHRKEMEKWLSVRQLLGVVTQRRAVTVRCRKITNQNTLASVASSWESSNKWSGGERWSKNMILFLGLLNFLAEKTGHVIQGHKRNRTVILDNPFGQASSDHVLNPVFFVAEQLGFQIITLTALAEGSFIRKYFPVVYSCRLRTATDGTQIMAKELQIQRALFKDHELPSIGRLETQDQLSLLE